MYMLYSAVALILFGYLILMGKVVAYVFNIKVTTFSTYVLLGVLVTSVLQWLIAMPLQLSHASWHSYFMLMCLQLAVTLMIGLWVIYQESVKFNVKKYLSHYWFVWLMVAISCVMAWCDTLPYNLYNYYDDGFYISRIGTQINAAQLANYDNYTGLFSQLTLDRVLTTYEIKYGFWLDLLHLDLIPFVRITCVMLAYLIIYHLLVWCIHQLNVLPKTLIQFVLSALLIYFISAAYSGYIGFFRSWDNWQFISAAYFGGHFVRTLALPLFIGVAYYFKVKRPPIIQQILLYGALCVTLLSYSSMSVTYIIIGSLIIYLLNAHYPKKLKYSFLGMIMSLFVVNFVLGISRLYYHPYYFMDVYIEYTKTYLRIYSIILIMLLIVGYYQLSLKDKLSYRSLVKPLLMIILASVLYIFVPISLTLSSGYMFVAARLGTSIQILLVLLTMMVWLHHAIKVRKVIYLVGYHIVIFLALLLLTYWHMPISQCELQRNGCQLPTTHMLTLKQPQTNDEITKLHDFIEKNKINDSFIVPNVIFDGQYDIQLGVQIRSVKGAQPKILNLYEKNHIEDMIIDNLEDYLHGTTSFLLEDSYQLLAQAKYVLINEHQLTTLDEAGIQYQPRLTVMFNHENYVLIEQQN